jgi:hypothetical protein
VTGPSSPRGERAGKPGVTWEAELRPGGEQIVPDNSWLGGHPVATPSPNRATRRAIARAARRRKS